VILQHHRKYSVDNVYLSFFSHALPKIQRQSGIALIQGRSWLPKMRRATNIKLSVGQPIPSLSHDPRLPPSQAAHLEKGLICGSLKAGIRRLSRKDVDLPMRTFVKIYMSFNKTHNREACSRGRTWKRRLHNVIPIYVPSWGRVIELITTWKHHLLLVLL
jgi:hypothetical protein